MPNKHEKKEERTGLVVQVLALLAVTAMLVLNQRNEPDIPDLFIWAMFGVVYGARPETFFPRGSK